ncbi:hypothetical protein FN846DRAFT_890309 [Sphaerosporella brunnea]|uniref:Uncharacterized protein n=1 Tax=Sphaerosporella brunnea TaxID=1250544 RepID=A0A5J5EX69_9PEZI|nr:hypothetical protein FN846DRAFT_890309 [Sphaerosporella brunnea]
MAAAECSGVGITIDRYRQRKQGAKQKQKPGGKGRKGVTPSSLPEICRSILVTFVRTEPFYIDTDRFEGFRFSFRALINQACVFLARLEEKRLGRFNHAGCAATGGGFPIYAVLKSVRTSRLEGALLSWLDSLSHLVRFSTEFISTKSQPTTAQWLGDTQPAQRREVGEREDGAESRGAAAKRASQPDPTTALVEHCGSDAQTEALGWEIAMHAAPPRPFEPQAMASIASPRSRASRDADVVQQTQSTSTTNGRLTRVWRRPGPAGRLLGVSSGSGDETGNCVTLVRTAFRDV